MRDPDSGETRPSRAGDVMVLAPRLTQIRYLEDTDAFDADAGVNHERTELRDPSGAVAVHDLWTSCFTPRELRLLARLAGLEVVELLSVTPGTYRRTPPGLDQPELLLVARRP